MHCGGTTINVWSDGTDAENGRTDLSIPQCEAQCSAHAAQCKAFVYRHSDDGCFWQEAPLGLNVNGGHDCYERP